MIAKSRVAKTSLIYPMKQSPSLSNLSHKFRPQNVAYKKPCSMMSKNYLKLQYPVLRSGGKNQTTVDEKTSINSFAQHKVP